MTVEIKIFGEDARHALRELQDFSEGMGGDPAPRNGRVEAPASTAAPEAKETPTSVATEPADTSTENQSGVDFDNIERPSNRQVGRPSVGKSRRTKAEKADDEKLESLAASFGVGLDKLNSTIENIGRASVWAELDGKANAEPDAEPTQISTGENRLGPDDDPEVEAQDKADEQAEAEGEPGKPATPEDLRAAMGEYVNKHGMPATQEDGPKIFNSVLGQPPEGEAGWKVTLVEQQGEAAITKAAEAWAKAAECDTRVGA